MSRSMLLVPLLLATGLVLADDDVPEAERPASATAAQPSTEAPQNQGAQEISGMSILGNQEAPKALVIVPWKSSELGASLGISPMLDDSRQPVDRDVFLRALRYHEIRSQKTP